LGFDNNTGYRNNVYNNNETIAWWNFRRAPGFFDEVCYTGNGSAQNVSHNLGVVPELTILKARSSPTPPEFIYSTEGGGTASWGWAVRGPSGEQLALSSSSGRAVAGVAAQFTVSSSAINLTSTAAINQSGSTFVAYLFASCPGVSKVGSYTGTGTTQQINCGFTAGARFVLIKRTDSSGDWYVWDSARGIVSGNDPYLLLNSTAAEVTSTDYVDTYSAGFEISSTAPAAINASGGTFIFLAIA
jgi:hypothetical protein